MELDILGHGKRISKIILVKKPTKKRTWKNQTTKTINKFCKKHEKICEFSEKANKCRLSRKEDYETRAKNNHPTNDNIICRKCQKEQEAENFYKNPSNKKGRAYICKKCKKRYDKKRNDTWEALIRSAYRASLYSHGNSSYKRASLDRIDTKKIGYKNNAQWLCVSCNKGKCTMSDEEHKQKFYKLFNIIEYLENLLVKNKISFNHSIAPDNNN